jgi:hypothetical protein
MTEILYEGRQYDTSNEQDTTDLMDVVQSNQQKGFINNQSFLATKLIVAIVELEWKLDSIRTIVRLTEG